MTGFMALSIPRHQFSISPEHSGILGGQSSKRELCRDCVTINLSEKDSVCIMQTTSLLAISSLIRSTAAPKSVIPIMHSDCEHYSRYTGSA